MKPANTEPLLLVGAVFPTYPHPADALLIVDGNIRAVGRRQDIDLPPHTTTKDLSGLTVLPGLGDAHVHFAATGFLQSAVDCRGIKTIAALLERVATEARKKAPGDLILGLRLEHLEFPSKRVPTLSELAAAAPENPVYLRHITGHSSVASASALALLDFQGGQPGVQVDTNSEPTGYLIAQATQAATQRMYALNAQQIGYETAFRAAAQRAAAQGCTAVHALDDLGAVEELLRLEPHLDVRVLPYTQSFDIEAVEALGLPRIGGCHGCALDGDFDMHTAALTTSYKGCPDDFGMLYHNDLSLQGFVLEAHRRNLQLAFHAIGDRAVEQALRAFERAQSEHPRLDPRHRIEHAQLMSSEQMARAVAAGVLLSVQPAFNHVWDHHTYDEWVGKRSNEVDPLATMLSAGLVLAGGSDSTVTDLQPVLGIHAAVNHSRVEERVSVADAVRMFSYGVAYSTFDEGVRGKVAPGFSADLTVLAQDPFAADPAALKDISVAMTFVQGRAVFEG